MNDSFEGETCGDVETGEGEELSTLTTDQLRNVTNTRMTGQIQKYH